MCVCISNMMTSEKLGVLEVSALNTRLYDSWSRYVVPRFLGSWRAFFPGLRTCHAVQTPGLCSCWNLCSNVFPSQHSPFIFYPLCKAAACPTEEVFRDLLLFPPLSSLNMFHDLSSQTSFHYCCFVYFLCSQMDVKLLEDGREFLPESQHLNQCLHSSS